MENKKYLGEIIDVEIDGIYICGEVVKENENSICVDVNGTVKWISKNDLP